MITFKANPRLVKSSSCPNFLLIYNIWTFICKKMSKYWSLLVSVSLKYCTDKKASLNSSYFFSESNCRSFKISFKERNRVAKLGLERSRKKGRKKTGRIQSKWISTRARSFQSTCSGFGLRREYRAVAKILIILLEKSRVFHEFNLLVFLDFFPI
jgi:hypothetical protein